MSVYMCFLVYIITICYGLDDGLSPSVFHVLEFDAGRCRGLMGGDWILLTASWRQQSCEQINDVSHDPVSSGTSEKESVLKSADFCKRKLPVAVSLLYSL